MRIAYMLTSLGIGGAERQVVALADRMAARGHQVVVVVLRSRERHEWPVKVEVVRLDMTRWPLGALRGLIRGQRFLCSFKPDILHSHTFPANMTARLARLVGATPIVLSTIHNICEGGWGRTLAYRLTDPLSRHTTAVSEAVADRYMQISAVPRHKLSVITNGIDVETFAPERYGPEHESARREDRFVWLAAGRAVPGKDFKNLLAAFMLVRTQAPEAQLWIAGQYHEQGHRIEKQVFGADSREWKSIRWLGLCEDMPTTIAAADAFVLSSAWEGMPLVVGEALAMEKPVVATDVGGVCELVGDAGVLVPPKAPHVLAEAMLRMMRMQPGERRGVGKAARARIVQHFDMNAKADEWETFYAELIGTQHVENSRIMGGRLMNEFPDGASGE